MTILNKPIDKVLDDMQKILLKLMQDPELLEDIKSKEKGYYLATKISAIEDPQKMLKHVDDDDVFYLKLAHKKYSEIKEVKKK